MAPRRKHRGEGFPIKAKGPTATQDTQVDVRGSLFPDEIYLEMIFHIPSVPIATNDSFERWYPEIRRSRHETLLSLSQTCRSLRRLFLRYLWQRIEVREGMKVGDSDSDTLARSESWCAKDILQKYTVELVRQSEIVTIRNPQLAQHVK